MSTHQYIAPFYAIACPPASPEVSRFGPFGKVSQAIDKADELARNGWEEIDVTNAFGYSTGDL